MSEEFTKVCMVGLGYIGLPTAAIMASRGLNVVGVDVNKKAIQTINEGRVHIVEPDLDIVVRSVVTTGNLKATDKPEPADAFLIAVPTPFKKGNVPDLSYIEAAAKAIAPSLEKGNLIVLESTSPVGTTEKLSKWLSEHRKDLSFPGEGNNAADVNIAYCPERVLPGHVLQELVNNDRIVGGLSTTCSKRAAELYKVFVKGDCLITTARTAELCKLTENAYRDTNIAFANEMSLVCDELGINTWDLIELSNRHPRVDILQPGPGVGGHCIAVDPWFLVDSAPNVTRLIRTSREVNDGKPQYIINKILESANKFKNPSIAFLGLAFKANIDDLRESPALSIVENFAKNEGMDINVVEPNISDIPLSLSQYRNVKLCDVENAVKRSDIVVGLVDHDEFKSINRDQFNEKMLIDTRGIWR